MKISVILTVKNEGQTIQRLLDSLAAQTRQPDEVVVCDGGSTDNTLDVLRAEKRLPLVVLVRPGANISQGRNAAIEAAAGDVLAVTDAGVWLEACWLHELLAPFEQSPAPHVVAGFFAPDAHTTFEVAMGATVLPQLPDIKPATFLPSSRSVAFSRQAWRAAGGYPNWLDFCEDLVFDLALRDTLGPFAFAPKALAHFRPRRTLPAFFKQYYQYARGDGKANLFFKRHLLRYATYGLLVPLVFLAGLLHSPCWWGVYALSIPCMFFTPYKRLLALWGKLSWGQRVQAAAWVPVIRVVGDLAKMAGYPAGVAWRLRRARGR